MFHCFSIFGMDLTCLLCGFFINVKYSFYCLLCSLLLQNLKFFFLIDCYGFSALACCFSFAWSSFLCFDVSKSYILGEYDLNSSFMPKLFTFSWGTKCQACSIFHLVFILSTNLSEFLQCHFFFLRFWLKLAFLSWAFLNLSYLSYFEGFMLAKKIWNCAQTVLQGDYFFFSKFPLCP